MNRYRAIIDDFNAFEDASRAPLPLSIWLNPLRTSISDLERWIDPDEHGLKALTWTGGAFRVKKSNSFCYAAAYLAGLFHIQEEIALLPVQLLDVRPEMRVLDLCAAPGNKTAQIAVALRGTGTVVGNDASRRRIGVVRTTMDRLGLTNVVLTVSDGANIPAEFGQYDRVLADVPCSCEGTSRKHPSVLNRFSMSNSLRLSQIQYNILRSAIQLCRPGGRIVYATCTYAPEENESVVARILTESDVRGHVNLIQPKLPGLRTAPGLTEWDGKRFPSELARTFRIWPHLNDTGGFYVAVFEKSPDAENIHADHPATFDGITIDPDKLLIRERDRFDLPGDVLKKYDCRQFSSKYASLVNRTLEPPVFPRPLTAGVRALNTKGPEPRLSTGGAMLLGGSARCSIVDLTPEELKNYLMRRDVTHSHTRPGAMLVQSGGLTFGLAAMSNLNVLHSLFPRSWAGVDVSAWLSRSTD